MYYLTIFVPSIEVPSVCTRLSWIVGCRNNHAYSLVLLKSTCYTVTYAGQIYVLRSGTSNQCISVVPSVMRLRINWDYGLYAEDKIKI